MAATQPGHNSRSYGALLGGPAEIVLSWPSSPCGVAASCRAELSIFPSRVSLFQAPGEPVQTGLLPRIGWRQASVAVKNYRQPQRQYLQLPRQMQPATGLARLSDPNVKFCKLWGKVTPSKLWSCKMLGKVTFTKLWLNSSPKVKLIRMFPPPKNTPKWMIYHGKSF